MLAALDVGTSLLFPFLVACCCHRPWAGARGLSFHGTLATLCRGGRFAKVKHRPHSRQQQFVGNTPLSVRALFRHECTPPIVGQWLCWWCAFSHHHYAEGRRGRCSQCARQGLFGHQVGVAGGAACGWLWQRTPPPSVVWRHCHVVWMTPDVSVCVWACGCECAATRTVLSAQMAMWRCAVHPSTTGRCLLCGIATCLWTWIAAEL